MTLGRYGVCLVVAGLSVAAADAQTARYRIHFDASWAADTHSGAFPSTAHFSPIIGCSHNDSVTFWEPGGIATPGMEAMAEDGLTAPLTNEINAARDAGTALQRFTNAALFGLPTTQNTSVRVTPAHPQVTAVTMIAPSPDWFLGVNGTVLYQDGVFLDNVHVDLYAWDAGTDSGGSFTAGNRNTNPQEPIRLIADEAPFAGRPPLGSFTFQLLRLPCEGDTDGDGRVTLNDLATVLAGIGQETEALVADGDVTNDRAVDMEDLSAVLTNFGVVCEQ